MRVRIRARLDLPSRPARPYTRAEVRAAIAALRLAVEIVDSRLPRGLGALAELADFFNNGALVAGPALVGWDAIDFARLEIVLTRAHDGAPDEVARGSAKAILDGDPFGTVVMLANAPPDAARGLRAGDIVTTGSCTGAPPLPGAARTAPSSRRSAASSSCSPHSRRRPARGERRIAPLGRSGATAHADRKIGLRRTSLASPAQSFALTKIQPPRARASLVARERLEEQMKKAALARRLVLIAAPAGFGKTAALARLIDALRGSASVAWISADVDDDPLGLLACLIAALEPLDPPWRTDPSG